MTTIAQRRTQYDDTPEIRGMLRALLRTSEGFPSPRSGAPGHALGTHLRAHGSQLEGARGTAPQKSRFHRSKDMVEAFRLALNTATGQRALRRLEAGGQTRSTIEPKIEFVCAVEIASGGPRTTKWSAAALSGAGVTALVCIAVLEVRERNGMGYLHVQSFFPDLAKSGLTTP